MAKTSVVNALAVKTEDAYSFGRYNSWVAVVRMLLNRGYTVEEAETILRSKWTRWAADSSMRPYSKATAKDVVRFLEGMPNERGAVKEMMEEF